LSHSVTAFASAASGRQNYRSVQPILQATNAVIALCPKRYNKDLFSTRQSNQKPKLVSVLDEEAQSDYVIQKILEHHEAGIPLKHQAVLFRAAHHSDALEVELSRKNIPFVKYGGLKFLEAAHVKDALSFLRLAENPRDTTAAFRVLQLLDGFGPAHARRAIEHLTANKGDPRAWADFSPPPAASNQWLSFLKLLLALNGLPLEVERWKLNVESSVFNSNSELPTFNSQRPTSNAAPSLPDQIAMIRAFYTPILEKRYDQPQPRSRDLEQLQQIASTFPSRRDLLADLTLDPPASTQDLAGPPLIEEDNLILSTIHSAKGCEWECVYVLHAADGNIPSDMATGSDDEIEEERRLFYVALTRAKDFLEVLFPLKYYHKKNRLSDRHTFAQLTRFLPDPVLSHFERVRLGVVPGPGPAARPTTAAADDLRRKIAGMWG
jgi:DNA helicase-2/ATP-dependent DNA helicase PcrA